MGTQSGITIKTGDNEYKHVYNNCDGDLYGAGKTLANHYKTLERVKELIDKGNISLLRPNIHPDPEKPHEWFDFDYNKEQADTSRFYGRDRGEEDEEAVIFKSLDEVHNYEYNYLFDGKKWLFRRENSKRWITLNQALKSIEGIEKIKT